LHTTRERECKVHSKNGCGSADWTTGVALE
jgi:hypothetical protein